MSNLTCPKCGGSDYFESRRNIVKGMGWAQRGSLKYVPVCRVCDEIMEGWKPIGGSSWEDFGRGTGKAPRDAYKVIKDAKPWIGSALASIFLLTLVLGFSIGRAISHFWFVGFLTLPIAVLATMFSFNLIARSHKDA